MSGTPSRRGPGKAGSGRSRGSRGTTRAGASGRPSRSRNQPPQPATPSVDVHVPGGVRLQKVLARAGVGSRRACEELIAAGRVEVDGRRVTELGVRIDPARSVVHVDGVRVQLDESLVYLALNKPLGVISAMSDPQGRPNLGDIVAGRHERLFHVGRLDADTEGLILLTNDGELAHRLSHPSYEVPKTYLAEVAGPIPRDLGKRLRAGIELEDGPAAVDSFTVVDARPGKALVELVLHDGRTRIVRRLLGAAGHPVEQLVRVQVGPIRLGDLRSGRTRVLGRAEVGALLAAAGM
ncbi:MAG TPA: pseudouridine synthase [Kineosporiaceae bacterium]|nr:pseudouridine synthase [Kineosporiaceae bacterium]